MPARWYLGGESDDVLSTSAVRAGIGLVGGRTTAGVIIGGTWNLTSKFLQGLPFCLGDEERREQTTQHEERKYLHNMVEPWRVTGSRRCSSLTERTEYYLRDDSTNFA